MTPTDSLWHWIGWTAAAATLLLLLYAIVGDAAGHRFRRRRRCPKCWYDLSHTPGMTCSECGYTARRERQLLRWRTRWRVIALTPLPWIGVYLWLYVPEMRQHGWIAGVPTAVLVHFTPPPAGEYLIEATAAGGRVGRTHPVIAEIERRLSEGEQFSPRQWHTLLKRARFVRTRSRWPVSLPVEMAVRSIQWKSSWLSTGEIMLVDSRGTPVQRLFAGRIYDPRTDRGEPSAQRVEPGDFIIDVPVHHFGAAARRLGAGPVSTRLRHRITLVPSLDEAIQPVSSPEIDAIVRGHLKPTIVKYERFGVRWPWLHVDLSRMGDSSMSHVALQVEVDLLSVDRVIAEGLVDPTPWPFGDPLERNEILLDHVRFEDLVAAPQNYALRIRGNGQRALSDLQATHYWAGSITIPCTEIPIEVQ